MVCDHRCGCCKNPIMPCQLQGSLTPVLPDSVLQQLLVIQALPCKFWSARDIVGWLLRHL